MKKGFTLIELLAVIMIIGVIALITTPIITNVVENSRESTRKDEANNIAKTINMKMIDEGISVNGVYTKVEALNSFGIKINGDKIIVTLVNDVAFVSLIFEDKSYLSNNTKVYGLKWDGNATYTRLNDAVGLIANVGVDSEVVQNDFDNAQIYSEIKDVIEDGNSFVKIPKFYIKKVVSGDEWQWYVSKIRIDEDYYLPACFMDENNNKELDYILVGKYDAALEGERLVSKTNTTPLVSRNINQFRTYAKNNNVGDVSGYQLIDIHTIDVLQVLFYIEFATLNSQSIMYGFSGGHSPWDNTIKVIGTGASSITVTSGKASNFSIGQLIDVATNVASRDVVINLKITNIVNDTITYQTTSGTTGSTSNISVNNVVYNVANLSGTTDNVASSSGSLISNTNKRYSMKYRGIENLYGNVFQYIDGINIDNSNSRIYVNRNATTYDSSLLSGDYAQISYLKYNIDGWVSKMGYDINNPFVQLPITTTSSSNTTYDDYYYQNSVSEVKALVFGGSWNHWDANGLSYYYIQNNATSIDLTFGSRLVKTPS